MNITCTRRLEFDAGHRLMDHEGKCRNPHGHRYVVDLTAEATPRLRGRGESSLDLVGRVIDFSVVKENVGKWLDDHWDHGFILHEADHPLIDALGNLGKMYTLPFNPTAENIARFLIESVCPATLEATNVRITHVRVWETPNCWADASL